MSEKKERKVYKLGDDAILMIRELIQLSILTGTNVIDHFRAMQLESNEEKEVYLSVTPEYIEGYNEMVNKLNEAAVKMQEEAQKKVVVDDGKNLS